MSEISPSERELDVLKVLWELGESKVRDVHAALDARQKTAFTTVQTILRIMADKGLALQRAVGRTLFYSPNYSREQLSSRFLDRVYDGALDKLVSPHDPGRGTLHRRNARTRKTDCQGPKRQAESFGVTQCSLLSRC